MCEAVLEVLCGGEFALIVLNTCQLVHQVSAYSPISVGYWDVLV